MKGRREERKRSRDRKKGNWEKTEGKKEEWGEESRESENYIYVCIY